MIEKKIKVPILKDYIKIVVFEDYRLINEMYNAEFTSTTEAVVTRWGDAGVLALFRKDKLTLQVLVHECVHIVNFIFKAKGIDLDIDNDELQAYLTDWVFNEINKTLTLN